MEQLPLYLSLIIVIIIDYILYRRQKKQIESLQDDKKNLIQRLSTDEKINLLLKELGYEYVSEKHEVHIQHRCSRHDNEVYIKAGKFNERYQDVVMENHPRCIFHAKTIPAHLEPMKNNRINLLNLEISKHFNRLDEHDKQLQKFNKNTHVDKQEKQDISELKRRIAKAESDGEEVWDLLIASGLAKEDKTVRTYLQYNLSLIFNLADKLGYKLSSEGEEATFELKI